jgi:hypothetical protein
MDTHHVMTSILLSVVFGLMVFGATLVAMVTYTREEDYGVRRWWGALVLVGALTCLLMGCQATSLFLSTMTH